MTPEEEALDSIHEVHRSVSQYVAELHNAAVAQSPPLLTTSAGWARGQLHLLRPLEGDESRIYNVGDEVRIVGIINEAVDRLLAEEPWQTGKFAELAPEARGLLLYMQGAALLLNS